jgi:hypothetical protein
MQSNEQQKSNIKKQKRKSNPKVLDSKISKKLDEILEKWIPKKYKDKSDEVYELNKKQIDYLFRKWL